MTCRADLGDRPAVELDTDAREASGLLAAAGSGEAYWSVLDEQRVEDSIVLIGRSGTATGGWQLERMTGRFRAPDVRTSDGEALARHDGFVYVVGSHFGMSDAGRRARLPRGDARRRARTERP